MNAVKPNILFVFSDQHRWCDLGCAGNGDVLTPNIDALASESAFMTSCVSNSPVCVPSRGTMLTGLMPNRHRAITNDLPIDPSCESIAGVMNRNGYHTGYIGKWHLGGIPRDKPIPSGERLGFTEWKVCNCNHQYDKTYCFDEQNRRMELGGYGPEAETDLAIDYIRRRAGSPWGLVLSYSPPHDPYELAPERFKAPYRAKLPSLRPNVPERIMDRTDRFLSKADILENCIGYYGHISAIDEQLGRLLQALEASGQADDTIVVYTSDHGDMLGSHGLTNKQLPYAESARVPLIVRWRGVTKARACGGLISLADLPVSLLSLAGMSFSSAVDGRDLSGLFTGSDDVGAPEVYMLDLVPCHQAYFRGSPEWRGIKTARFTYARSFDGRFRVLFDDESDPFQLRNLASDEALCAELEPRLLALAQKYDEFLPWDEFIIKHGYLADWNASQRHFGLPELLRK